MVGVGHFVEQFHPQHGPPGVISFGSLSCRDRKAAVDARSHRRTQQALAGILPAGRVSEILRSLRKQVP